MQVLKTTPKVLHHFQNLMTFQCRTTTRRHLRPKRKVHEGMPSDRPKIEGFPRTAPPLPHKISGHLMKATKYSPPTTKVIQNRLTQHLNIFYNYNFVLQLHPKLIFVSIEKLFERILTLHGLHELETDVSDLLHHVGLVGVVLL